MYLQTRIPPPDRPMFRFLWRNLKVDRSPDVYEFERVVFGDASALFEGLEGDQSSKKFEGTKGGMIQYSSHLCKSTLQIVPMEQ